MVIEENGKLYNIDEETGLVTLAATAEVGLEDAPELPETPWQTVTEFHGGERVEVEGNGGHVVSVTSSVYGDAVAVRHDDGRVEEYAAEQVKHANNPALRSDNPIEAIREQFAAYEALPNVTAAEISHKASVAKQLLADTKAILLRTSAVGDAAVLDRFAFQLTSDLKDFEEASELLLMAANEEYLTSQPRYRTAENFSAPAPNLGVRGNAADASWLELETDDYSYAEVTDADMAARAAETVAYFSREQLEDDSFIADASQFQSGYLGIADDQEKRAKFASYVERARQERLAEPVKEAKVAAVDDDVTDFDATALFV